ncbi:hypothetical protein Tco_0976027 [Tanacetum coccineum]|uniref:Uncharacterized protein n=1 Tax=Tanacetum coccineum TaxID=301880 RepID=A0ABQ5EG29_9ASTR
MKSLNTSTDSKSKLLNRMGQIHGRSSIRYLDIVKAQGLEMHDPNYTLNVMYHRSKSKLYVRFYRAFSIALYVIGFHVKPTTDGFCTGAIENRYIQCALQDVRSREATQEKQTMRCNVYGSTRVRGNYYVYKGLYTSSLVCADTFRVSAFDQLEHNAT